MWAACLHLSAARAAQGSPSEILPGRWLELRRGGTQAVLRQAVCDCVCVPPPPWSWACPLRLPSLLPPVPGVALARSARPPVCLWLCACLLLAHPPAGCRPSLELRLRAPPAFLRGPPGPARPQQGTPKTNGLTAFRRGLRRQIVQVGQTAFRRGFRRQIV